MRDPAKNAAYIDAANLHKGMRGLGWRLSYPRFRAWLADKYGVVNAYLFIGFLPGNKDLYVALQKAGFVLVYKEVTHGAAGAVKGNCDAALVLKVTRDFYERKFDQAIIVSSDGDYAELVAFLKEKAALRILISPSNKCSFLLRKQNIQLLYLDTRREHLALTSK